MALERMDDLQETPDPLLDRVRQVARDEEPEGWVEVAASVMTRVRDVVVPAEPVLAFSSAGRAEQDDAGSTTHVSSRIVQAALRRVLRRPTHAPERIDLTITDGRLVLVELRLVCSYGLDLVALADTVRGQVHDELIDLLGPDPAFTRAAVAVDIVDVVLGNPHLV